MVLALEDALWLVLCCMPHTGGAGEGLDALCQDDAKQERAAGASS